MAKRDDLLNIEPTIVWSGKANRKYFLEYLINKYNYTSMIEVGVRDGRTTFYLLDNIPSLTIYAIDKNISFAKNNILEKYENRLIPIRGLSSEVAELVPRVDIVFIDADHRYKPCKSDILLYREKANGILCGHDIDYPGVNQAVNELIKNYEVGPNNVWFIEPASS
jgi:predicted O-methyltransferase YrrM